MASVHDESILPTSHKLPAINTGRLVTGAGKGLSGDMDSAVDSWAVQVRRRLQEQVNNGDEPGADLVEELVRQVVSAVITTLQNDRRVYWLRLYDILCLLEPYAELLKGKHQITHYLERVYNHVQTHQERLFDVNILQALTKVFPQDMDRLQHTGGNPRNFRTPTPPRLLSTTPTTSTKRTSLSSIGLQLPDGSNPYVLERPGDETKYFHPKPMSMMDLRAAIPAVVLEASARESVWGTSMGITATALSLDLHDELKPAPPEKMSESLPSITESKLDEDVSVSEEAESISEAPPMTGREAAEMFVKGKHLGKVEFVYLNLTPNRHFRPYDLTVVPKQKINKEHYVFSRFGALHVRPNEPNDTMSIAEWNQEAVWWSSLTCIPFFKHFLVRKAFLRWKSYKRYEDFCRTREEVEETLPIAVPRFGAALLHISRLLLELTAVNILPSETNISFTLPEFETIIRKKRKEAEKILTKFFGYSQAVVNQIVSEIFEHLQHCEQQVKNTKTVYTKESLYLQRQKKEQRVQNFKKAKAVASRLGNFVKLVDQMLLAHMVSLARANIGAFVHKTMQAGEQAGRDALFKAKLVFNKNDELLLYPSKDKFQNATYSALLGIPAIIYCSARPSEDGTSTSGSPGTGSRGKLESSQSSPVKLAVSQESTRGQMHPTGESGLNPSSIQTTRSGAITASVSSYTLADPTLARAAMKTKEEDRLGVATPDLVVGAQTPRGLNVGGQGFMGQYSPLSKGSLETKLATDEVVSADMQLHEHMMQSAMREIDSFCMEQQWLKPMHKYAREWSRSVLKTFHGQDAFVIEEKLTELKNWIERIKDVEKSFTTSDCLFHMDCSVLQQELVPALSNIFKQLIQLVADDAKSLSTNFVEEIKILSKTLKNQKTSVDQFAVFAGQVKEYQSRTQQSQEKVSYIKSLYEVIRMSYRSLNPDEEKLEERVRTTWESFLVQLQEAHDFVHTQTPVMLEQLDQTYQTLHEEALAICHQATSGKFLDPSQHAPTILVDMRHLAEKFSVVQHNMEETSRWREMIVGTGYDLSALGIMVQQMDVRRELWKYVEVATYHIKDWKLLLFRKMNVKKAMGKLTEWQTAAMMMGEDVPQDDRVLAHWVSMMQDFKQNLPLLAKLGSDALKHRHWKQLYVGMGKDPNEMGWSMTVGDLIDLDLPKHSQLINQIFTAATSEFALEQSLGKLRRMWEEKDFKLAKYIRELPVRREKPKRTGSPVARLQAAKSRSRSRVVTEETYILIGTDELRYQLEDSEVTLQAMLASPHIADLRSQAEVWRVTLQQVDDIVHLWTECQTKWLFLSKSFADINLTLQLPDEAAMFSEVDSKYKAFMQDVVEDPKMLSVLSKRRGQKGWRELQGEALRQLLKWCIEEQEKIIKKLDSKLMATRNEFPRLHFLSNSEIVELLSLSRDPRTMTSFVKKCFHGIRALTFALPADISQTTTALDLDLHAEVLQATMIKGEAGEVTELVTRVEANTQTTQWLQVIEQTMRNTVGSSLQACMEARLGKDPMAVHTWVQLFPSQCTVLTEAVLWAHDVSAALQNSDRQKLLHLRENISSSMEERLGILQELYRDQSIRKAHITLGNLVNQAVHQRDVISMLLEAKTLTDKSFDWQKVMKYSMDTKPSVDTTVTKQTQHIQSEDMDDSEATRLVLEVKQGFKFGPCLVSQLSWSLPYEYEYLGPVNRLIVTPLTDRCLLSLSGAVQSFACGAVMGPEGAGKSETVAELARALGRNFITFNCTHQTRISALTQYLVGGIQSGAWVCLDDANHLSTGVMSVLSHHLEHLRNAYRILAASTDSQYSVRGAQPGCRRVKSVTSLVFFSPEELEETFEHLESGHHRRHSLYSADQKELHSARSALPHNQQDLMTPWHSTSSFSYKPQTLGLVTFNSDLMRANASFSPFLTLNTREQSFQTIPETLRSAYRPVTMIKADRKLVVQSILLCGGFQGYRLLAGKLDTFLQLLEKQILSMEMATTSLHSVKVILALAQQELQTRWLQISSAATTDQQSPLQPSSLEMEEMALVRGISATLIPTLHSPGEVSRVKDLLRMVFPITNRPASAKSNDPVLINAIQEHMEADKLQATPKHLEKILQLWAALQAQQGVMLVGPSGSGKTTTYRVLAEVLNILNENIYASSETPDIYPTPKISKSRLVGSLERRMTQEDPRRKAVDDSPDKLPSSKSIARMDLAVLPEASFCTKVDYPRVDGAVLVPNAHSLEDLLGFYDSNDNFWKDGLLTNFLRNALHTAEAAKKMIQQFQSSDRRHSKSNLSEPTTVYQWVIMDGRFDPPWSECVVTLLDQNHGIHLNNGDTIALEPTTSLLFEMSELAGASPSLVGRSAIVYFEDGEHIWKSTVESWFQQAYNRWTVTSQTIQVWTDLINDVFPPTIEFLSSNAVSVLDVDTSYSSRQRSPSCEGLQEVSSFLSILSSLLNKHMARDPTEANSVRSQSPRDETRSQASLTSVGSQRRVIRLEDLSPSNQAIVSQSMFVFAYIWGFGGHLHERHTAAFDLFARKILSQANQEILIPPIGSVYDYCIDTKHGNLIRWQEKQNPERSRLMISTYTILPEVERYSFLIDLLATSQQAVLLAGIPGVGKTALMQNLIQPKHNFTRIAMSSGLSPSQLQQMIEFKMDMLTKRSVTARTISSKGKLSNQQVFFIDDMNMAGNDHCGTQPCLEVLRQIMAHGGVYNIDKHSFKPISNAAFVAACTSPAVAGAGNSAACHQMSRRLIRLFTVIAFHPPSLDSMKKLYTGMLQSWLEEFPVYSVAHHSRMANAIVSACHDLYRQVSAHLPPTPQKALHVFSLHDLSRVVQGMLLLTPRVRGKPRPVRTRASSRTWSVVSGDTSTSEGTGRSVSIFPVPPPEDASDRRTPRRGLSRAGVQSDTPVVPPLQKLVVRLWCHEAIRTFADRLFWDEDVQWFREALTSTVEKHFCTGEEGYDPSRPFVMPSIAEASVEQKKASTPHRYMSPPPRALSAASQEISAVTGEEEEEEGEGDEDVGQDAERGTLTSERTTDGDGYETEATDYETDVTTPESRMTRATADYSEYETATTPGTEATTPMSEEEDEEDEDGETDAETVKTEAENTLETDDETTTIKTGFEGTSVIEEEDEGTVKSPSAWSSKSETEEDVDLTTTGTGDKSGIPVSSGTAGTETSNTSSRGETAPTTTPKLEKPQTGRKSKSPRKSVSPVKTGTKSVSPVGMVTGKEEKSVEEVLKHREEPRPATKEKGSRHGVTFKPGLVADSSQEDYLGPLVPLELVLPPGDDIMNIIFSKFISGTARTDGIEGYMETGMDQLSSSLNRFLSNYNAKTTNKLDLVFFKQAIHHLVRLTRVLATIGGHALLIGTSNHTGRVSTAKLATFIVRAKFFHAKPAKDPSDNRSNLHKVLKDAFFVCGVQGREGVLLVGEEMGTECLQDICTLMLEGMCLGLYSDEELMIIANQIMQGTVTGKHSDKFELALDRYHKRIRTNLHVVVTMDLTGPDPLHHRVRQFPTLLLRSSCVDMYSRWTFEARVNVAMNWIAHDSSKRSDVLWEMLGSSTSLTSMAHAMAYVHRSAQAALQRCFHDNHQLRRLFTPLTYMEFIDLFKSISAKLIKEEKANIVMYEGCLSKVQEAQDTIACQQAEVEKLLPQLDEAREITQEWIYKVEEGRAAYSKALQQCKDEEDRIEAMQGPLEQLRQAAQAEFDKVNPAYRAAVLALRSLSHVDLDEIKSYRVPPPGVVLVVNALCIIFGVELDWELGHQLISRQNFFEELEFYDKNNMPEPVFQKLKVFVKDPHFDPRVIQGSSKAAESVCMWVHAVYQYAAIHRDIKPKLEQLAEADSKMNDAQAALGAKRVHAEEEKNNLESTIRSHTDSIRHSKSIEKQIRVLKDKTAKCQNVLTNMEEPISMWTTQLKKAQKRLTTAPGDSLVTAACVCYLGPFDSITRQTLLQDWLHHCRTGEKIKSYKKQMMVPLNSREEGGRSPRKGRERSAKHSKVVSDEQTPPSSIAVRDNFTLQSTLSTTTEQVTWRQMGMPTNLTAIQNALIMRSCWQNRKRCWPLLVDPDGQAETWVRALQETTTSWEGEQQTVESAKDGSRPSSTTTQHTRDKSVRDSREKARPGSTLQPEDSTAGLTDSRSTTPLADRDTPSSQQTPDFHLDLGIYMDRPISPPEGCVEVISADDPFLNTSLIRAVITGYCLLVTHVERTGISSPVLRKLLDRATLESNKSVKVADQDIPYHPGFCLYLSISSPVYMKGAGMASLPMYKTAVIDLSVSRAGVVKLLLKETLKLERPEYEGQRRSLQADIIQLEKDLQEEKDNMIQKVLELQTPILEDSTMLDALRSFQERVLEIDATIAETQSLQEQVSEKKRDYQPVASHGAILYVAIQRIAQFHPMYHYPLTNFIQMYINSVKSRQRGKGTGNVGAIKARVIELTDCLTRMIYSRLERSMFSQHALLFALLIVIDKMKEAEEITEEEWAVFANGIDGISDVQKSSQTLDASIMDTSLTKPDWLSFETWVDCALLERLPCFRGLRESLSGHSKHWLEYFSCPPILLNPVTGPTLLNLNLIQKAILWRIIKPEQMISICESLVLYKLGHVVSRPDTRSVEEAFLASEHHTPIVLLLPASPGTNTSFSSCRGYPYMDPFWEIKKLAKPLGMHGRVQQVMLGLPEEMRGAAGVLERGMVKGHWVVFNNCQMAGEWSQDVLELVKTIVTSAFITVSLQEESDVADDSESQDGKGLGESPRLNPNFRLWLVTTAEASTSIPGVALQHGVKLAYELPQDIPATVSTTYNNAVWAGQQLHTGQPRTLDQMQPLLMSVSLVHSLLLHRRKYGISAFTAPHHWNQDSLNSAVEILQGLLHVADTDRTDCLIEGYQTLVGDLVYGGRVTDHMDLDVVKSMVKQWTAGLDHNKTENAPLVSALLSSVKEGMHSRSHATQNKADLNSDPTIVGLDVSGAHDFHLERSRNTLHELEMVTGVHGIRTPFMMQYEGAVPLLQQLQSYLQQVSELPQTSQDRAVGRLDLVQEFLLTEVEHYKELLRHVRADVGIMQSALKGEIGLTTEVEQLLSAVVQHRVPQSWLVNSYPTTTGLTNWVQTLQSRLEALQQYVQVEGGPVLVNLAAFINPVGFLNAVLLQHCRQQFRDVQTFQYEVKVLEPDDLVTSRPSHGICLTGLYVHGALWDSKHGGLQQPTREHVTSPLPKVWMKIVDMTLNRRTQASVPTYTCPLYISDPKNDILGADNVVTYLHLPSAADLDILVQRRVYLTSAL